jgi:hypothetical protein
MTARQRYFRFLGVLACVAVAVALATGWPIGLVALALFVGWPLIGTLITLDDDLPGGWSNPDGKTKPEWKTLTWNLEILLCRGSIVVAAFGIQYHDDPQLAASLFLCAIVMGAIGFPRIVAALRNQSRAVDGAVTKN